GARHTWPSGSPASRCRHVPPPVACRLLKVLVPARDRHFVRLWPSLGSGPPCAVQTPSVGSICWPRLHIQPDPEPPPRSAHLPRRAAPCRPDEVRALPRSVFGLRCAASFLVGSCVHANAYQSDAAENGWRSIQVPTSARRLPTAHPSNWTTQPGHGCAT